MASIARRDDGRWRARYRDPAGREHARHFTPEGRRAAVARHVVTAVNTGAWVDPQRGAGTVAEWAQDGSRGKVAPQAHAPWERTPASCCASTCCPSGARHRIADVGHGGPSAGSRPSSASDVPVDVHKIHRRLSRWC